MTTGQLYVIRDVDMPLLPSHWLLGPLLTAAISFTDQSTRDARVPLAVGQKLKEEIRRWFLDHSDSADSDELDANVDAVYVEAAMVVATYNMVSRFLLSTDVAGISDDLVPWPVERHEVSCTSPSIVGFLE